MLKWLVLALTIISEVIGSLSLKGAQQQPWLYILVAVGYIVAFILLTLVLKMGMPVGVAYGIWAAAGIVLTALFSTILFNEPLTPLMIVGIGVIVAGVLLVEIGSQIAEGKRARLEAGITEGVKS